MMQEDQNKKEEHKNAEESGTGEEYRKETKSGIKGIGDIREKIHELEQKDIPREHEEYEELRDELEILLDHLLFDQQIDLETSHLIRSKLRRINTLFLEMGEVGHYKENRIDAKDQLDFDKEKYDSKLEVVQLILSQIFPKLKKYIGKSPKH